MYSQPGSFTAGHLYIYRRLQMEGYTLLGIVFLILAFVFIALETLMPGFGAPGIAGICSLTAGVVLCSSSLKQAMLITAVMIILLGVFVFVILKLLASGKIRSPLVLKESLDKENGFISTDNKADMIGLQGTALTDLRPAGKMSADGRTLDVVSEGPFIKKGTAVIITGMKNSSLTVKENQDRRE